MMKSNDSKAVSAVTSLRVQAMLREVPKVKIAQATGLHRDTVAKYLKSPDIPLNAYVAIAEAIGEDPAEILAKASKGGDLTWKKSR